MSRTRLASALIVLGLAVGVAAAAPLWWDRAAGEPDGRPHSGPDTPDLLRAGSVIHYSVETFIDFDRRRADGVPFAAEQSRLTTERWVELGADGRVARFKNITRKPDGSVWQEQLYDGQVLRLHWAKRPFDGLTCTDILPYGPTGSTLPQPDLAALRSNGFSPQQRASAADLNRAGLPSSGKWTVLEKKAPISVAPEYPSMRSVVFIDPASGQMRGQLTYGVQADGSELLVESETRTAFGTVTVDQLSIFAQDDSPPCAGARRPSDSPQPGGGQVPSVPTPAPARGE